MKDISCAEGRRWKKSRGSANEHGRDVFAQHRVAFAAEASDTGGGLHAKPDQIGSPAIGWHPRGGTAGCKSKRTHTYSDVEARHPCLHT